ncbi:unnamed protein product [Rotaria socialis]|uniref:Ubiquitin carboxyl-terminal hydrolase n=2 Tax=Rotaria socialis TaxID=392032 RepID=A0A818FRT3_9BILA|nr:unnamed protein product [Rotaria socialis]
MTYHSRQYICYFWMPGAACGPHFNLDHLFTANDLDSRMNDICGYMVSDYVLIESRCRGFHKNALICSRHRYLFCEGYIPEKYCMFKRCNRIKELMYMGPNAALFIGNVPILGYICSDHRTALEIEMPMKNLRPVFLTQSGQCKIWDCVVNAPPINIRSASTENSLVTVTDQQRCDDHSSCGKSENENNRSTATYTGLSNSPPVENDIKTNKIHLTLRTKQDDTSLERNAHSNQQHQPNVLMPKTDVYVIQEKETNQARRFTRQSSPSKSSRAEPMEMQRFIYLKICANTSTSHKRQSAPMLETDTFAILKAKIVDTFALNHSPSDLSLLYASSNTDNIQWKTLKNEEENRTLAELSFDDDYIVTWASSKCLGKGSISSSSDIQQPDCLADQYDVYPLPGLQNLGNTCFMNSVLQCLNHVEQFFNYFRGTKIKTLLYSENIGEENNLILTRRYSELIESLCSSHNETVIPVKFHIDFGRLTPHFYNYHQHDSLEFMNIFLDILHEDLMRILQQNYSIVSETFHGQIRTVVTCKQCGTELETNDSFSFLPLPIPEENNKVQSSSTRGYKLDQCFQTFFQEERIRNHGQWHCDHCGKLTDARKTLCLKKLPPVLILQLKRFNYDLRSYAKNETLIEYDLDNLDLNEYVVQSHRDTSIRYNLIAVSNHWGSLIGGHFVTYAKLPRNQDWYKYNDDRVHKIDKNMHVNNSSAYILIYKQEEKDSITATTV